MCEIATLVSDTLLAILPHSDIGKLVGLLIIAWFLLILTGRFRLEWIGAGTVHVCRWLRCKIRDKAQIAARRYR